jgi:hypothetical protein
MSRAVLSRSQTPFSFAPIDVVDFETTTESQQASLTDMSSRKPLNSPNATNSTPNLQNPITPKILSASSHHRHQDISKVLSAFKPPRPRGTTQNTPSSASNDLPSRIAQLKATIQHTEQQISETLEKYEKVKAKKKGREEEREGGGLAADTLTSLSKLSSTSTSSSLVAAEATLNNHIALLKQYNALKDAGMTLIEVIAEREGKRVVEVKGDFGVGEED